MESTPTTPPTTVSQVVQNSEITSNNPIITDEKTLESELSVMIKFAILQGKVLPQSISNLNSNGTSSNKLIAYNDMINTISPATAGSIHYVNSEILGLERDSKWYQAPVFIKCLIIAGFALLILILVSLSPLVNESNQSQGLLNSSGFTLLFNLVFICSASLLGVMFYLLKTISDKIKAYTLLQVDSVEMNATILIGLISGFIIAELFTFTVSDFAGSIEIHKMTLALLGGFSSDAIFSVLKGIVAKIKAFFAPGLNEA